MKEDDIVIAVDIGYAQVKTVTDKQRFMFPSRVGPARKSIIELDDKEAPGEIVTFLGQDFFVGEKALSSDTTFTDKTRGWVSGEMYGALIVSTLVRCNKSLDNSSNVFVVTGLPVDYISDEAKAEEQVRQAASTLNINVTDVKVLPQPYGTYYDYRVDMSGEPLPTDKIGLLGVIDVGFNTCDYILIADGRNHLARGGGSISTGVFNIIDGVRRDIMHYLGRSNLTLSEIEECIRRTKTIRFGKRTVDVSQIVDTHMHNTARTIIGAIQSRWAPEGELDVVLLTGGGSVLLKDYLVDTFCNAHLVASAQMANARGYFKFGRFLQKAERS